MKTAFEECVKVSDDVDNLKVTDEEQNKIIYVMCSKKFKECGDEQRKKWWEHKKNNKDQKKTEEKTEEQTEEKTEEKTEHKHEHHMHRGHSKLDWEAKKKMWEERLVSIL